MAGGRQVGREDDGKKKSEKKIRKLIRESYYDKKKARIYYDKNQEKINNRGKKAWADLTEEERETYYKVRKLKRRKLKDV